MTSRNGLGHVVVVGEVRFGGVRWQMTKFTSFYDFQRKQTGGRIGREISVELNPVPRHQRN